MLDNVSSNTLPLLDFTLKYTMLLKHINKIFYQLVYHTANHMSGKKALNGNITKDV